MIGATVGVVFGGSATEIINSTIPRNAVVAQPQAYALVKIVLQQASFEFCHFIIFHLQVKIYL